MQPDPAGGEATKHPFGSWTMPVCRVLKARLMQGHGYIKPRYPAELRPRETELPAAE